MQLLRQIKRKLLPYRSLPSNDDLALRQGLELIRLIGDYNANSDVILEVGTGWIPTIPCMLKACGTRQVILTDIEHLCDPTTFDYARSLVEGSLDEIAEVCASEPDVLRTNLFHTDGYDYRCPPRLDELESNSVDLIYSRTVLEHIPEPMLRELLAEWKRLLKPGGYCIHFIDNSDHFEHRDKRLSRLNFLTTPDWAWRIACFHPQNYQNRLRHSDYVELFKTGDYDLKDVNGEPDPQAMADLGHLSLDKKFDGYGREDLAILTSVIVARNPIDNEVSATAARAGASS